MGDGDIRGNALLSEVVRWGRLESLMGHHWANGPCLDWAVDPLVGLPLLCHYTLEVG